MIWICYVLLGFLLLRTAVSLTNAVFTPRLPEKSVHDGSPAVSVLIPARNEENTIGSLLGDLNTFGDKNLEILVFDDQSDDQTRSITEQYGATNPLIRLIEGKKLPPGWLGKNHACDCLAREAKGDYLLFLDADVRVKNGLLEKSLTYMKKYQLQLLSIFPKQEMLTPGEMVSVPIMNWILLSLLPLFMVRTSRNPAFSAANGQFMLFDKHAYQSIWPHRLFKNHRVEDMAIIRQYKKMGLKTATLLGDDFIRCRMYTGLPDAINGFSKNVFQFFGNSMWLALLFFIITTLTPFLAFYSCGIFMGILSVLLILLIRIMISHASSQHVFRNLVLWVPQHVVFLLIIGKATVNQFRKSIIWKGRNVA